MSDAERSRPVPGEDETLSEGELQEVSGGTDRYTNQDTSTLLSSTESYATLTPLASNLKPAEPTTTERIIRK